MKCIGLAGRKKAPRGTWACPACVMYAREKVKDDVVNTGDENDTDDDNVHEGVDDEESEEGDVEEEEEEEGGEEEEE